jgi:hypothetical protein
VLAEYAGEPSDAAAFRRAMSHVERSRRRTGATSRGLYQDAADPARFVETFTVASWAEHLAQHHDRCTGLDREFETRARRLPAGPPRITHAPESPPSREPTSPRPAEKGRRSGEPWSCRGPAGVRSPSGPRSSCRSKGQGLSSPPPSAPPFASHCR